MYGTDAISGHEAVNDVVDDEGRILWNSEEKGGENGTGKAFVKAGKREKSGERAIVIATTQQVEGEWCTSSNTTHVAFKQSFSPTSIVDIIQG